MSEQLATLRVLNESAIREHALECSKKFRAGKFTRVGQDFLDEVHADVEALVRNVRNSSPTSLHDPLPTELTFTTGALVDKVQEALNGLVGRIIQNKVQRQPTVGVTLSRTR